MKRSDAINALVKLVNEHETMNNYEFCCYLLDFIEKEIGMRAPGYERRGKLGNIVADFQHEGWEPEDKEA